MSRRDLVIRHWGARFMGRFFPCAVGRGGIGDKRGEGDGITPVGIHRIEEIWIRSDRLGYRGPLPARPIGIRHGWSDDPADPAYNRLVLRPHAHSHEAMRRADPMYDLVAVLDWNRAPVVRGRGSAIFLHVWRGPRRPTAGCVAFRRADLAWILANWQAQSRVVIRR